MLTAKQLEAEITAQNKIVEAFRQHRHRVIQNGRYSMNMQLVMLICFSMNCSH